MAMGSRLEHVGLGRSFRRSCYAQLVPARPKFKVFISNREGTCGECGAALARSAWIHLDQAL